MSTPVTWIEITGCKSSVTLISPISPAQSRHFRITSSASRPGIGERKVPWFSAASRRPVKPFSASTSGTKAPSSSVFSSRASLRRFFAAVASAWPSLIASQVTLCRRSSIGSRRWAYSRLALSKCRRMPSENGSSPSATASHKSPTAISWPSSRSSRRSTSSCIINLSAVRSRCSAADTAIKVCTSAGLKG